VTERVVFLASGASWSVPAGVTLLTKIEKIGGGQAGLNGGGKLAGSGGVGGDYACLSNVPVTPGDAIPYTIGPAGAAPGGAGGDTSWNNGQGRAKGGGSAGASVGDTVVAGGSFIGQIGGNAGNAGSVSWTQTSDGATAAPGGTAAAGSTGQLYGGGGSGGNVGGGPGLAGAPGIIVITHPEPLPPGGVTLPTTAAVLAGAASGGAAAGGAALPSGAALLAGVAAGGATTIGATLSAPAAILPGVPSGGAAAGGMVVASPASIAPGAAAAGAGAAGAIGTATTALVPGAVAAGAAVAGAPIDLGFNVLPGAATGGADAPGAARTALGSLISGFARGGATAPGIALAAEVGVLSGTVTGAAETFLPGAVTALDEELSLTWRGLDAIDPVEIETVWDAWRCPARLLVWFAWALSVDHIWDDAWPERTKRQVIADSPYYHRIKGSVLAVELTMALLRRAYVLTEWWEVEPKARRGTASLFLELHVDDDLKALRAKALAYARVAKPKSRAIFVNVGVRAAGLITVGAAATTGGVLTVEPFRVEMPELAGPLPIRAGYATQSTLTVQPRAA
jgi:phage tail P2-like protein